MGKASFATLQDQSGRIQLYISNDATGIETHDAFKHWGLGDIVGAAGTLFKTKTGELTIQASSLKLLTKALRPLPEKFHGIADQELKYRQRYLDLIVSPKTREVFESENAGYPGAARGDGRRRLPRSRDSDDEPLPAVR